jgi:RNA polymerase sigma-70 factor (ECF subfamily)
MATVAEPKADEALDVADLVREHQADVWRFLRYLGCAPAEADDLTQETFICVLQKPFEQRSRAETAAYLRTVARRRLLVARRDEGHGPATRDLELAEEVWATAITDRPASDSVEALRDCLQSAVTDRVREALALRYGDDVSRERIAELLEMTADGVKTMLRRARAALRECIERKLKK